MSVFALKKFDVYLITRLGVWAFICLMMVLVYNIPLRDGLFFDSDDYLRMVRVGDWLDGNARHDFTQPRLGPAHAEGGVGWSRIVDMPLITAVAVLEPLAGRHAALMIVATFYPAVLMLIFLTALCWSIRQGFPRAQEILALAGAALLPTMTVQLSPGRVDHHGWQLILLVLGVGLLLRIFHAPADRRAALCAGILMALSWAVGPEAIPWVVMITAAVGIFWLLDGDHVRDFHRAGLYYGGGLLAGTVVLIPLSGPLTSFFRTECDSVSLMHIGWAAAVPVFWWAMGYVGAHRLVGGSIVTGVLAGILYALFPDCLHDPYVVSDPELRRIWLEEIVEARSVLAFRTTDPLLLWLYMAPLLSGLTISIVMALRARAQGGRQWIIWMMFTFLMLTASAMPLWQIRTAYLGHALVIFPLSAFFMTLGRLWLRAPRVIRLRISLMFFLVTACMAGISLVSKSIQKDDEKKTGSVALCDVQAAAGILNSFPGEQIIAAHAINGGELLFRTRHRVLAGSYQRDAEGIMAAHRLLMSGDDDASLRIVKDYGIDFVLVCDRDKDYWERTSRREDSLAARLLEGVAPRWLVPLVRERDFALYRVRSAADR